MRPSERVSTGSFSQCRSDHDDTLTPPPRRNQCNEVRLRDGEFHLSYKRIWEELKVTGKYEVDEELGVEEEGTQRDRLIDWIRTGSRID